MQTHNRRLCPEVGTSVDVSDRLGPLYRARKTWRNQTSCKKKPKNQMMQKNPKKSKENKKSEDTPNSSMSTGQIIKLVIWPAQKKQAAHRFSTEKAKSDNLSLRVQFKRKENRRKIQLTLSRTWCWLVVLQKAEVPRKDPDAPCRSSRPNCSAVCRLRNRASVESQNFRQNFRWWHLRK